jgi:hypothetical protein
MGGERGIAGREGERCWGSADGGVGGGSGSGRGRGGGL